MNPQFLAWLDDYLNNLNCVAVASTELIAEKAAVQRIQDMAQAFDKVEPQSANLRKKALDFAIVYARSSGKEHTPSELLKLADEFYEYLSK
jgi:hypothetical protein